MEHKTEFLKKEEKGNELMTLKKLNKIQYNESFVVEDQK